MFTGIITHQGTIKRVETAGENMAVALAISRVHLRRGDSVALNGVCLTVVSAAKGMYNVVIMPETSRCTTLRRLKKGDRVNIELPLKYGERLGGHFALGHIDTVGKIMTALKGKNGTTVKIEFPNRFKHLAAAKGSIAIDGISLTIVSLGRDWLSVSLIPYTIKHTTLGNINAGDKVNIEFDIFARYVHAQNS